MNVMQYGLHDVDFRDPAPARPGLSRRLFLVSSLASGFAVAAGAAQASTITTDSKGLVAGEVQIPVADGQIPAYYAAPAKAKRAPVLLVIEEIFGVHEHIRDICRRYAKLGYYAIAPELFSRQGDVAKMSDINEILSKVIVNVPDAQVMADLDATLAYAGKQATDAQRVGILGYCWGGRTVWLYAAHNPAVKAGVAYYGLLSGMKSAIKPQDPLDIAAALRVPVLGLYAGKDAYIKSDIVDSMHTALAQGSSGSEIIVFPGVDHGFNADYRPTYDAASADYAAKLAREWLHDHGV